MKLYNFIILSVIFSVSCNSNNEKPAYNIHETGEYLSFPVPDSIYPYAYEVVYLDNGNDGVLYYLSTSNTITKYNINDCSINKIINLDEKGDNGVGKCYGMTIIDEDLFFVAPKFTRRFYKVNDKGDVLERYSYGNSNQMISPPAVGEGLDFISLNNEEILIPQTLIGNVFNKSRDELRAFKTFLIYNLENGNIDKQGASMPYADDNVLNRDWEYSFAKNNDQLVVSFGGYHDIFVTTNLTEYKQIPCKSENFFGTPGYIATGQDIIEQMRSVAENCTYGDIIWDTYRKLYYRLYKIGQKLDNDSNIKEERNFPGQIGVMVLNEDFEILADKLLSPNTYCKYNYFVNRDGLYLSLSPKAEAYDLDYLTFELIKISEND